MNGLISASSRPEGRQYRETGDQHDCTDDDPDPLSIHPARASEKIGTLQDPEKSDEGENDSQDSPNDSTVHNHLLGRNPPENIFPGDRPSTDPTTLCPDRMKWRSQPRSQRRGREGGLAEPFSLWSCVNLG